MEAAKLFLAANIPESKHCDEAPNTQDLDSQMSSFCRLASTILFFADFSTRGSSS